VVVLLGIGLLAGVVTALSPCVLPVLPVLLAGGASGRKPFRIIGGLIVSFVVFTLFATWILQKLGLPDDLLRNIAIGLLFLLAAILIVPQFGELIERPFARLTRFRAGGGGFLLGASLGLVFVPCAGPVLAAISVNAARFTFGWRTVLLTVAYAIGAAIPMLLIAYGGNRLGRRLRAYAPQVRLVSGVVIALVAVGIAFNEDARFQTLLPGYTQALQKHVEDTGTATKQLAKITGEKPRRIVAAREPAPTGKTSPEAAAAAALPNYGAAPPLIAGGRWFNSKPLTLTQLRGKVVLLDFWTYSCINCLRTLPHLESWYATYHRDGLVIIGVHSPEFAFEHVASNVAAAIKRLGIKYPVMQDNNFATWTNYQNEYWPAEFLIDKQGNIRGYDFGEGDYGEMEDHIRDLLGVSSTAKAVPNLTPTEITTPESYLGFNRLDPTRYVGTAVARNKVKTYKPAMTLPLNALSYSGAWRVEAQRIVAGTSAGLTLHFEAKNVYLVLGGHGRVNVMVGAEPSKTIDVDADKLYTLRMSGTFADALLHLRFSPGVQAYAFTFG
jgi:cytochrome c biogenesis protein CcdA/thiol-disulfide isomerase/thioredoxin